MYFVKRNGAHIGGEHRHLQGALDAGAAIVELGGPVQIVDDTAEGERVVATLHQKEKGHVNG